MSPYPKHTRNPSNTLKPSLMYFIIPNAPIFMNISTVKMKLKIMLLISTIFVSAAGWSWCSIPMLSIKFTLILFQLFTIHLRLLRMMLILIKCWNFVLLTIWFSFDVNRIVFVLKDDLSLVTSSNTFDFGEALKTLSSSNSLTQPFWFVIGISFNLISSFKIFSWMLFGYPIYDY